MAVQNIEGQVPVLYKERDEAATPVGDFIAQVAAAIAFITGFLTLYTSEAGVLIKGYERAYGIMIIAVAGVAFLFASYVLLTKFIDSNHWLARSPGWAYGAAAALVIVISVMSMVFADSTYTINWSVPFVQFLTGTFLAIGGMLKFS